jgi:hypothetical protein
MKEHPKFSNANGLDKESIVLFMKKFYMLLEKELNVDIKCHNTHDTPEKQIVLYCKKLYNNLPSQSPVRHPLLTALVQNVSSYTAHILLNVSEKTIDEVKGKDISNSLLFELTTHDNHFGETHYTTIEKSILQWIKRICHVISGSTNVIYRQFYEEKVLLEMFLKDAPLEKKTISIKFFLKVKSELDVRKAHLNIIALCPHEKQKDELDILEHL